MGCSSSKAGSDRIRVDTGSNSAPHRTKLVVCGDRSTGKSCLVARYVKGAFPDTPQSTIGAAFATKDVTLEDKTSIRLQIWDTAGEEVYRAMTKSFFRDALIGFIVYDVTNPASFNNVKSWLDEFREQCPESVAVLVANKVDLRHNMRVSADAAREFASRHDMTYFEVSAKSGEGVDALFAEAAKELHNKRVTRTGPFA